LGIFLRQEHYVRTKGKNGLVSHLLETAYRFVEVTPLYTPTTGDEADDIYITRSYDASSHFETVVEDVQDVWKRVLKKELVLKKRDVQFES